MRRFAPVPVVALLAALAVPTTAPAEAPAGAAPGAKPGGFEVEWGRIRKPHRKAAKVVRRAKPFTRVSRLVNRQLEIPVEIGVLVSDQIDVGPAYIPEARLTTGETVSFINIPGEFLRTSSRVMRRALRGERGLTPRRGLVYSLEFVFAHEVGHALVDKLDLPVTGREEDAVDGFAAYVLAKSPRFGFRSALSAAVFFDAISDDPRHFGAEDFADEHSLSQQRVYQFLCWMYGSAPKQMRGIVGRDGLPKSRAPRCRAEWRQLNRSWSKLLEPHMKPAA